MAARQSVNPSVIRHLSSHSHQTLRSATLHNVLLSSSIGQGGFRWQAPLALSTVRAFTLSRSLLQANPQSTPPSPKDEASEQPEVKDQKEQQEQKAEEPNKEEKEKTQEEQQEKEQEKEKPPPPPPHGDKTPWTVFVETLSTEFKASKEWNESTKALASSAHQFTESDSVKKAREAYEKSSKIAGAASSATGETLKKAATAVGKGAAWTWETPVVKAGRTAVKATGSGVEKITRPIRETEVYKSVKGNVQDVLDDGSSSRYGGFLEREERKKAREARELKKHGGKMPEKLEEDPKYSAILFEWWSHFELIM